MERVKRVLYVVVAVLAVGGAGWLLGKGSEQPHDLAALRVLWLQTWAQWWTVLQEPAPLWFVAGAVLAVTLLVVAHFFLGRHR